MSATVGPNLGINHSYADGESGWKTGMDANLKLVDTLLQLQVKDKDLTAPPGSPANGDRYIVGASATGAWAGKDKQIAVYDVNAWAFYPAKDGWMAWVTDEDKIYVYNASAWQQYAPGIAGGTARKLWIPASAFGYNLNAVASGATPGVARSSPLDAGSYEYINLPAAGDTYLQTWWKVPDDFAALSGFDLYLVANGTSTTNLTMGWHYILAAAHDAFADNLGTLATLTLTVAPTSAGRMVIKVGIALPSGPPTLTAGSIAKMYLERINANDANPDDYRFVGVLMRYTT